MKEAANLEWTLPPPPFHSRRTASRPLTAGLAGLIQIKDSQRGDASY